MKAIKIILLSGILIGLVLSSCTSNSTTGSGPIKIENAWARTAIKDGTGAVYFVVNNTATQEDKMVSVSSDVSETAEMHITVMEGSMMKMMMQKNIPIGAGGKVELKPGGTHIMLMNLKKDLKPKDIVQLTLTFEKGGKVDLSVPVKEP